jgi:hypothetical protein
MKDKRYERRVKRLSKKAQRQTSKATRLKDKSMAQLSGDHTTWTEKQKKKAARLMKRSHKTRERSKRTSEKLDKTYATRQSPLSERKPEKNTWPNNKNVNTAPEKKKINPFNIIGRKLKKGGRVRDMFKEQYD